VSATDFSPEGRPPSGEPVSPLLSWLAIAALADWLITRTVTRTAIFMPKSPMMIAVYEALSVIGQFAATLASLLTIVAMLWLAWRAWRGGRALLLASALLALVVFSVVFIFVPLAGWQAFVYRALLWASVVAMGREAARQGELRVAWVVAASAVSLGAIHQAFPSIGLFNAGELCATLAPLAIWWGRRRARGGTPTAYLLAAIPALTFVGVYFANPAMTGIIAIWSIGLTLYLPWWVYAMSLWLACVIVVACWQRREFASALPIVLLAAGGYAPQLSTQVFLNLIALWLLAAPTAHSDCPPRRAPLPHIAFPPLP